MTKNDQKLKILFFFHQNLFFLSFFDPLTILYIFLIYIFEKYLLFWRFWYKKFENRVKTQLPAFIKNFWNMNINKKKIKSLWTEFLPDFQNFSTKIFKKESSFEKNIYKKI